MKTLKLVLGILSLVFSIIVLLQSCAVGVVNTLDSSTGDVGGSAGLIVAILFIAGGVMMIVTRNSEKKAGAIACIILYIIAALLGFSNSVVYQDLVVWASFALVLAVVSLISVIIKKKEIPTNKTDNSPETITK